MTEKRNKRKKPEILTPDKSGGPYGKSAREADTSSSPPPIIDMQAEKKGSLMMALAAGVLGGALAGGVVLTALYYVSFAEDRSKAARQLADAEARLVVLESQEERVAAALALIVDSEARLSGLETTLDTVSQGLNETTTARLARIDAMAQEHASRLTQLETAYAELSASGRAQAAMQTPPSALLRPVLLSNLSQAIQAGRPFELELAAVGRAFPEQTAELLSALAPYAVTGLPRRTQISADFLAKVPQLLTDMRRTQADGFWARLVADVSSVLRIRRLDGATGTDARSVLIQMERLLQADAPDALPQALRLHATLPEAVQANLTEWSAAAAAHIATQQLLTELSGQISALNAPDAKP